MTAIGRVSSCGCPKPVGSWGVGGWHFFEANDTWAKTQGMNAFPDDEQKAKEYAAFIGRYKGTPIAYEPCPAYRRSFEARHRADTASVAATNSFGGRRL